MDVCHRTADMWDTLLPSSGWGGEVEQKKHTSRQGKSFYTLVFTECKKCVTFCVFTFLLLPDEASSCLAWLLSVYSVKLFAWSLFFFLLLN